MSLRAVGTKAVRLVAMIAIGLAAKSATAATITFDNSSDLSNNFVVNVQTNTSGGTAYVPVSSGGVGNSGAIQVNGGPSNTLDATGVYTGQSYNLQNGTVSISQMVHVAPITAIGDRLLHLGLLDDTAADRRLNGGGTAHASFISARYSPTAVSSGGTTPYVYNVQLGTSDGTAATATTNNPNSAAVNLTVGDWYLFTINVNLSPTANTWSVDSTLQDYGTDGLTPGAVTTQAAQTITATTAGVANFYNDTTDFAAFRSFNSTGGADLLDTFTVTGPANPTPEPATLGLLSVGAVALLARRRRVNA